MTTKRKLVKKLFPRGGIKCWKIFLQAHFKRKQTKAKAFVIYIFINPWLGPRYLPHLMGTEEKTTQKPRAYRKKE
jgi:hypothetical protein